jgi:hypothetical protein
MRWINTKKDWVEKVDCYRVMFAEKSVAVPVTINHPPLKWRRGVLLLNEL